MDISQQAAGWKTNQLPEEGSPASDWMLSTPVVTMMGIEAGCVVCIQAQEYIQANDRDG